MTTNPTDISCPSCNGIGSHAGIACTRKPGQGAQIVQFPCDVCQGTGHVTPGQMAAILERESAGKTLRAEREARGLSVVQEAKRLGITPYELVRRERGKG